MPLQAGELHPLLSGIDGLSLLLMCRNRLLGAAQGSQKVWVALPTLHAFGVANARHTFTTHCANGGNIDLEQYLQHVEAYADAVPCNTHVI